MKKIVIINGSAGVGKDTFSSICNDFCKTWNYSSVDKIKEIAKLCGWDGIKDEKGRIFLSELKVATSKYNDLPFKCMKEKIDEFKYSDAELLFLHIREPEEIARAASAFNAVTLLIKSNRVNHITTNNSDANVFNFKYDAVINNDRSIEDLKNTAKWFIERLRKMEDVM